MEEAILVKIILFSDKLYSKMFKMFNNYVKSFYSLISELTTKTWVGISISI